MKTCSKCGKKKSTQSFYSGSMCKACNKKRLKQWRAENKDVVKDYYSENRKRFYASANKSNKKSRESISDQYVLKQLRRTTKMSYKEIKKNPDLMELQRITIKLFRLCKSKKQVQ